jgi:ADP-ribosyl-[dinitrogen reductase] hydrolase
MNKSQIKDKIRATFLGVAIGDALGKPVEMWDAAKIKEKFGRIEDYQDCNNHKYFQNDPKGTTTDDWQLTKAIARAFIDTGEFNMDAIAAEHAKEFAITVGGWGGSTRESVANLVEGVHWTDSGRTDKENRGTGNGISMKVTPVGLFMALTNPKCSDPPWTDHINNIRDLSAMTHRTSVAVTSGIAHAFATFKCFTDGFDKASFIRMLNGAADLGRQFFPETLKDDLKTRFELLKNDFTDEQIIQEFGGGTCYVYDSLPFTYAFFLKNPNNIDSLYDCISAGGDADSNGSMLAGLLGSLHGMKIFPKHLIDGLNNSEEVLSIADEFCDSFTN